MEEKNANQLQATTSSTPSRNEQKWLERFYQWKDYHRCRQADLGGSSGKKPKLEKVLSDWINTQRSQYKLLLDGDNARRKSCLTMERKKLLEDAGFCWASSNGVNIPSKVEEVRPAVNQPSRRNCADAEGRGDSNGRISTELLRGKEKRDDLKKSAKTKVAKSVNSAGENAVTLESLKPVFRVGQKVYAPLFHKEDHKNEECSWFLATIEDRYEVGTSEYGIVWEYDVIFDDTEERRSEVDEYFVFSEEDYVLSTSDSKRGQDWIGVTNYQDLESSDEWARIVGYYEATIDGKKQKFAFLYDALLAYDRAVVGSRGSSTKQKDLNLKDEWSFDSRGPPVFVGKKKVGTAFSCSKQSFEESMENTNSFPIARNEHRKPLAANVSLADYSDNCNRYGEKWFERFQMWKKCNDNGEAQPSTVRGWVQTVRKSYASDTLSEDHINLLNEFGFSWKAFEKVEEQWSVQFERWKKCMQNPGGLESVSRAWIHKQRKAYSTKTLPAERVRLLSAAGFDWTANKSKEVKHASSKNRRICALPEVDRRLPLRKRKVVQSPTRESSISSAPIVSPCSVATDCQNLSNGHSELEGITRVVNRSGGGTNQRVRKAPERFVARPSRQGLGVQEGDDKFLVSTSPKGSDQSSKVHDHQKSKKPSNAWRKSLAAAKTHAREDVSISHPNENNTSSVALSNTALEQRWLKMFNQWKFTKEKNDDKVKQHPKVKNWVKWQRSEYRRLQRGESSGLTPARLELLQSAGMSFNEREKKKRQWLAMFEQWKLLKKNNGVKLASPKMMNWIKWQKSEARRQIMNPTRLKLLQNSGFFNNERTKNCFGNQVTNGSKRKKGLRSELSDRTNKTIRRLGGTRPNEQNGLATNHQSSVCEKRNLKWLQMFEEWKQLKQSNDVTISVNPKMKYWIKDQKREAKKQERGMHSTFASNPSRMKLLRGSGFFEDVEIDCRGKESPKGSRGQPERKVEPQGSNAIMQKSSVPKKMRLKPVLKPGDKVIVPSSLPRQQNLESCLSWRFGVVQGRKEVRKGDVYGNIFAYDISFEDGTMMKCVEEIFVFRKNDYLLSTLKREDEHWVGVKTVTDEKSSDAWAQSVGWYASLIDGREHQFSSLADAVRARDIYVVKLNGRWTKKTELNIPEEWDFTKLDEKPTYIGTHQVGDPCSIEDDSGSSIDWKEKNLIPWIKNVIGFDTPSESGHVSTKPDSTTSLLSDQVRRSARSTKEDRGTSPYSKLMALADAALSLKVESPSSEQTNTQSADTAPPKKPKRKSENDYSTPTKSAPKVNGYGSPKLGEKVYVLTKMENGPDEEWVPGRVWDVNKEESSVSRYDVVLNNGAVSTNISTFKVIPKLDFELQNSLVANLF